MQHLVIAFAEAEHQAAFGRGAASCEQLQRAERGRVTGARTHLRGESLDGFDVVPDNIGLRRRHRVQQLGAGVEIWNKELDRCVVILSTDGFDGGSPVAGASVGQIITCNGCYDNVPKTHQLHAAGQLPGLCIVGRKRTSRARGAETAAPCADIAQNHEGSCPATPAFGFVGAHPAAANRVQGMFPNDPVHLGELRRAVEANFQPAGFFRYVYLVVIQLRHLSSLFSN